MARCRPLRWRTPVTVEGYTPADGEEIPTPGLRIVAPGFFDTLGVPIIAGRDFTDDDRRGGDRSFIVSQSVAHRLFPGGDAVNRHVWWIEPMFGKPSRSASSALSRTRTMSDRAGPALTLYHPCSSCRTAAGCSCAPRAIRTSSWNRSRGLFTRFRRTASRARRHARRRARRGAGPDRLNAFVLSGFAAIALLIAVVGVAGVLAFSASRPHARVRRPAGRWFDAAPAVAGRAVGRRVDRRDRSRGGRRGGYSLRPVAASISTTLRCPARHGLVAAAVLVSAAFVGVADAGGTGLARRRAAGARAE